MQTTHVLEVAVFKVKPEYVSDIPSLRAGMRATLKDFPGLIEFNGYCPAGVGVFADIVKWSSHEHANAAAKAIESGDARFLPYMSAIEEVTFMGHFVPDAA
jgi:hypothetical protein